VGQASPIATNGQGVAEYKSLTTGSGGLDYYALKFLPENFQK